MPISTRCLEIAYDVGITAFILVWTFAAKAVEVSFMLLREVECLNIGCLDFNICSVVTSAKEVILMVLIIIEK